MGVCVNDIQFRVRGKVARGVTENNRIYVKINVRNSRQTVSMSSKTGSHYNV